MKTNNILFLAQQLYRSCCTLLLLLLLMSGSSCDDFVTVSLPNSQLTGTTVFESSLTANAAIAQVYIQLRDAGILTGLSTGSPSTLALYADETQDYTTGLTLPTYQNALTADNATVASLWNISYSQIYKANSILEGVTNSTALPETTRSQLKGEALFIRALVHFYLGNIYGAVPYVTKTDYEINRHLPRVPLQEVYKAVAQDLEAATFLIAEDYSTPERVRPNKMTVQALLARTYLYMGLNAEASNAASAVLNSSLYVWEPNLDKIFLKNSTTTIWQFAPPSSGRNSYEGGTFIFVSGPPPSTALRNDFIASFELGDQRKTSWTKAVLKGSSTWYHSFKYKQRSTTASSQEYSIVFRLAEQYLIRAEARAKQGDLIGAKEDLNKIRNTAGLSNTTAVTESTLLDEVIKQRRFEFFTEYGHRFFDLKRSGTINAVLSVSKPGWNATDVLWPIPINELNANPNLLPQNLGY
ncbi:RagB/SusD family nutrient uptake outer membrane protein [Flavobacterium sp. P4023]|uniref:RagB/SusD family nutrient uptake outer membrane protein n=1 Tax=Flavobacterium flabelliforme TaxID=2816119 RepID=A0ABS5CTW6_9FLAO|nr:MULTISPECIES: RagB/SusD family nutrient uptake outer membrane protein [Flavobacterium]MBP4142055.1 RagB/SusD family nutrient uptake outer membrane protein [Flavobacterium flabelliforme]